MYIILDFCKFNQTLYRAREGEYANLYLSIDRAIQYSFTVRLSYNGIDEYITSELCNNVIFIVNK